MIKQDTRIDVSTDLGEKLDDVTWHHFEGGENYDEKTYYEYAGAHIACFVYWLITRGHFQAMDAHQEADAECVKDGKLTGSRFLLEQMDLKLFSGNSAPATRNFAIDYYSKVYIEDYTNVILGDRASYTVMPAKKEYENMARAIDARYEEYRNDPSHFKLRGAHAASTNSHSRLLMIIAIVTGCIMTISLLIKVFGAL